MSWHSPSFAISHGEGGLRSKHKTELEAQSEQVQQIRDIEAEKGTVTLLYSAKDGEHDQAVVLKDHLPS